MRFRSERVGGFRVFAVSGVNTISFGVDATAAALKPGLLGFSVEEWLKKYAPGKLRAKRRRIYTEMAGFAQA
jgi:hypothetical protein